ncbi:MAG: 4'-phosphopantetheinyl transferase superfamily protein [Pseudomonadales bacterium]|nr:4'-phosphopantetheinyl transferase superfamily protein [Pseudomonadales bacterium]
MMKIAKHEIHLWVVLDQEIKDPALLESYQALLSAEEEVRHQRFIFPRHRHQYLVTRALARAILAEYDQAATPENLLFVRNEYGKPGVTGFSKGSQLSFNISHTEGLVVLAVCVADYKLGVDVEYMARTADILKLAERYFSPQEVRDLNDLKVSELNGRFFDLWTLKESYIKACGQGLTIPLEEFSFELNARSIRISFSPQRNDDPERWRFWQLQPSPGHKLALAVTGKNVSDFSLSCYKGVPLQGFVQHKCQTLRSS